jgi:hypothetical protein
MAMAIINYYWLFVNYWLLVVGSWNITDWPWGPAVRFYSALRYVRRDFRKKKSGPRTPRPPGGPPVLGSLVWRAEGLICLARAIGPSGGPCHPPARPRAPGDTQGNVSRQLAGAVAVVLGGGAAPAPPLTGSGRSCAPALLRFECLSKTRGAQALRHCGGRPGRDG